MRGILSMTLMPLFCLASYGSLHECVINDKEQIPLVANGKADVEVVVQPQSAPIVAFAAKELKNGGFEDKLKSWSIGKGEGLAWDEDFRYSGHASLRVEGKELGTVVATQYLPELNPNTRYRLTFVVKAKDIVRNPKGPYYHYGTSGAFINLWVGMGKNLYFPRNALLAGSVRWTPLGYEIDTGDRAPSHPFYIRAGIMDATGTAWFDDIRLEEIPSP